MEGENVAAVDCGTNSTRLLVNDSDGRALVRMMRITRLGEGVDATGVLSPAAIARTVAVLEEYRAVCDDHGVARIRAVATSAARDAANPEMFFDAAEAALGVRPELLSGVEEGRLSLAGATASLEGDGQPVLVLDIGGGSTELVVGSGPTDPTVEAVSLQLGCVRLTERFLRHDPPLAGEVEAATAAVVEALAAARKQLTRLPDAGRLIGLAGTVTTLTAMELGLVEYDRERVHHCVLPLESVVRWSTRLAGEGHDERLAHPGMIPGRADVILGGVLVLRTVMEELGFDTCLVSESDILDGLGASLRAAAS